MSSSLAIIAYFRDEAHILNEWLLHHLSSGVSHFYLINDRSKDSYLDVLRNYSEEVTLIESEGLSQIQAYQKVYKIVRNKYDWAIFLDLDEFLYIEKGDKDISKFLSSIKSRINALLVSWTIFLPTKLLQAKSVIECSEASCIEDKISVMPFKTIFRTNAIEVERVSYHRPKNLKFWEKKYFKPKNKILRINHYRFQSYEYLLGIKSERGGGVHKAKYRNAAACNLINRYLESPIEKNNGLALRSSNVIQKVKDMKQNRPLVTIYNSESWAKVYNSLKDRKDIKSHIELLNIVSSLLRTIN